MERPVSRSEFLQKLGRTGMLAGLFGVGASALHGTRAVEDCFNHNYCDSCWAFTGCTLPEKKEAKNERSDEIRPA